MFESQLTRKISLSSPLMGWVMVSVLLPPVDPAPLGSSRMRAIRAFGSSCVRGSRRMNVFVVGECDYGGAVDIVTETRVPRDVVTASICVFNKGDFGWVDIEYYFTGCFCRGDSGGDGDCKSSKEEEK